MRVFRIGMVVVRLFCVMIPLSCTYFAGALWLLHCVEMRLTYILLFFVVVFFF